MARFYLSPDFLLCSSMILLRFFGANEFDAELKGTALK